jgi:hypothetical protein
MFRATNEVTLASKFPKETLSTKYCAAECFPHSKSPGLLKSMNSQLTCTESMFAPKNSVK